MFDQIKMTYVATDIFCLFLVSMPMIAINLGKISPVNTGFFCRDTAIQLPYYEAIISAKALGTLGICLATVALIIGESLSVYLDLLQSNSFIKNNYVATIYKAVGTFLFGAAINQSLTDIIKYSVGRLRPYFLYVCDPEWKTIDCSRGLVENYTCQGDPQRVTHARLSFYSGRSAFSMYCMLFVSLYIHARLKGSWARLLRPTLQFILVAMSLYVGVSQATYHQNHWSDVYVGFAEGIVVAIFVTVHVSGFFKDKSPPLKDKSPPLKDKSPPLEDKKGKDDAKPTVSEAPPTANTVDTREPQTEDTADKQPPPPADTAYSESPPLMKDEETNLEP